MQAILFTSANGVRAFAGLSPRRDIGVLAVGDATAAAARAAGFTAVESAGGDVGDLVRLTKQRLKPEAGPLFHAAGSAVAGDLARLLGEGGFTLRRRMLYESNAATDFTPAARSALLAGQVDQVVLFSPRTAATFVALAKAAACEYRADQRTLPQPRGRRCRKNANLARDPDSHPSRSSLYAGADR